MKKTNNTNDYEGLFKTLGLKNPKNKASSACERLESEFDFTHKKPFNPKDFESEIYTPIGKPIKNIENHIKHVMKSIKGEESNSVNPDKKLLESIKSLMDKHSDYDINNTMGSLKSVIDSHKRTEIIKSVQDGKYKKEYIDMFRRFGDIKYPAKKERDLSTLIDKIDAMSQKIDSLNKKIESLNKSSNTTFWQKIKSRLFFL